MNLRQFSMALLISALPLVALADPSISFNEGDFKSAQRISQNGETLLKVKLSKSGKAKLKKLNKNSINRRIHSKIAGVSSDLKLRALTTGDGMEIGPYSAEDAQEITPEINNKM